MNCVILDVNNFVTKFVTRKDRPFIGNGVGLHIIRHFSFPSQFNSIFFFTKNLLHLSLLKTLKHL